MLTISEIKQEISHLNMDGKLWLVEDLWDFIAFNETDLPISEAQKQELDKRYKDYQQGNVTLHGMNQNGLENQDIVIHAN